MFKFSDSKSELRIQAQKLVAEFIKNGGSINKYNAKGEFVNG